jgi:DNA primase
MAEAGGSFADRVKQQADIVRVVGEYVRLKKSGQNFYGLCVPVPFRKDAVVCRASGEADLSLLRVRRGRRRFQVRDGDGQDHVPGAMRAVAEKCGIAVPRARERTPEERQQNQQRTRWWKCTAKRRHFSRSN